MTDTSIQNSLIDISWDIYICGNLLWTISLTVKVANLVSSWEEEDQKINSMIKNAFYANAKADQRVQAYLIAELNKAFPDDFTEEQVEKWLEDNLKIEIKM